MEIKKPKRRWQNLVHKKCPNCSEHLTDQDRYGNPSPYLICPTPHATEEGKNCFFIKKEIAGNMLLDPKHPANFCLNSSEKSMVGTLLQEFGIIN